MKFPEQYRLKRSALGYESKTGDDFGSFIIPKNNSFERPLGIIANSGIETGWDHVSVSVIGCKDTTPSWKEMCLVKDLFWNEDECVVQYHPPKSDYVNNHPGVLHLWKYVNAKFPMPPKICV